MRPTIDLFISPIFRKRRKVSITLIGRDTQRRCIVRHWLTTPSFTSFVQTDTLKVYRAASFFLIPPQILHKLLFESPPQLLLWLISLWCGQLRHSTFFASDIYNHLTEYAHDCYVLLSSFCYFPTLFLFHWSLALFTEEHFAISVHAHAHVLRENGIDIDWKEMFFLTKEGSRQLSVAIKLQSQ